MNQPRYQLIQTRLQTGLSPMALELLDESHLHAGHAGAEGGRGHYRVKIVSSQFVGMKAIARHQLVYRTLGELMQTDIHALSITALTPDELPARSL